MVKITKLSTKEEVWQEVLDRTYSGNGDFTKSEQKLFIIIFGSIINWMRK